MSQLVKRILPPDHTLYLLGDTHEGNVMKAHDQLRQVIDRIRRQKDAYVIHVGDAIDAIVSDDKRYSRDIVDSNSALPVQQARAVVKEFLPIKHKILYMLDGNHEWKLERFGNLTKDIICHELGVPYGTAECKLLAANRSGVVKYRVYTTHGNGSLPKGAKDKLQRKGNRMAALKRKLEPLASDCILMAMGHTHQIHVYDARQDPELHLIDDGEKLKQVYLQAFTQNGIVHPDYRVYCNTGSFLKSRGQLGISGYAERMLLPPAELGYVKVTVRNYDVYKAEEVTV